MKIGPHKPERSNEMRCGIHEAWGNCSLLTKVILELVTFVLQSYPCSRMHFFWSVRSTNAKLTIYNYTLLEWIRQTHKLPSKADIVQRNFTQTCVFWKLLCHKEPQLLLNIFFQIYSEWKWMDLVKMWHIIIVKKNPLEGSHEARLGRSHLWSHYFGSCSRRVRVLSLDHHTCTKLSKE